MHLKCHQEIKEPVEIMKCRNNQQAGPSGEAPSSSCNCCIKHSGKGTLILLLKWRWHLCNSYHSLGGACIIFYNTSEPSSSRPSCNLVVDSNSDNDKWTSVVRIFPGKEPDLSSSKDFSLFDYENGWRWNPVKKRIYVRKIQTATVLTFLKSYANLCMFNPVYGCVQVHAKLNRNPKTWE